LKLLRFGPVGKEKPGLLDSEGRLRDLSNHLNDVTPDVLSPSRLNQLSRLDPTTLPVAKGSPRLGIPVSGIGKIVGVGLNYGAHAAEAKMETAPEPLIFAKATTALCGPNDSVMIPKGSTATDHEVELAIVIGSKAQYVSEADAYDVVAGYAVINDISERDYQLNRGGQFFKGKSADTFAPLGPWLVTKDEIPTPQNLRLWLELNGDIRQDSTTAEMIAKIPYLISHISSVMTLMPGDVIATGTPEGVGMGRDPQDYLKPGDVMRLGVEGLGEQRQEVIAYKKAPE